MIHIQLQKQLHAATGRMDLQVDLQIPLGSFVAISGPSGGGKTTLLRLIAGLEKPEAGLIRYREETWLNTGERISVRTQRRKIGLVFQDYALFPNMTVEKNLAYALHRGQDPAVVQDLMTITELTELAGRYPANLSGGQQQRVALARALVRKPGLLLLDEPLSALDTAMRSRLQDYILELHHSFQLTTILVSHDFTEIKKMAEKVYWLENGRILKEGPPGEVFKTTPSSQQPELIGAVQEIYSRLGKSKIKVRIGANLIEVPLPAEQARSLKINSPVTLQWSATGLHLKK
jgi:molybdate transport system ATP-binding protein